MREVAVKVKDDYLARMLSTRNPVTALAELIWNALDAEATDISVEFIENKLGGIKKIKVSDNGHGINYEDALPAFENLGGSWKKASTHSKGGVRRLHGKKGQGRFQAFSLGALVSWRTRYRLGRHVVEYSIIGRRERLGIFNLDDEPHQVKGEETGTLVEIENIDDGVAALQSASAFQTITEQFALYLRQYPNVRVLYDGEILDPALAEERVEEISLDEVELDDGTVMDCKLTIIEWKNSTERYLYLCDAEGFSLAEVRPNIHAPGFDFTAYLKSDYLRHLDNQNSLVEEFNPNLKKLLTAARTKIREHFRRRATENAARTVESWKETKIYPYEGEARTIIEQTERQVFDVLAIGLNDYLPTFEDLDSKNKKLAFALLRQSLEESPRAVQKILEEVLELPAEKQEEFAQLLERTSLTAIINASKLVADRLDFLRGLEILVFNPTSKKQLLERKQLHKILEEHTWIFGEEFNLSSSDKSLDDVLTKHLNMLVGDVDDLEPVRREDGSEAIVDLMLSRSIPQHRAEEREHLIVELKRPAKKVDSGVTTQIESYAFAVAGDERFRDTRTKWVFWAISNEMSDSVRRKANQKNRPNGLLFEDNEEQITIWVKTWGQLIDSCRARLEFFQKELNYSAENDSAISYLKRMHEKLLPPYFSEEIPAETAG